MIHVQHLFPLIDVPLLCDVFRTYGAIISASIAVDDNNQSLEVGYVRFKNASDAVRAATELNEKYTRIGKLSCKVIDDNAKKTHMHNTKLKDQIFDQDEYYNTEYTNLYVKNIDLSWDECDLLNAFERFGAIQNAQIETYENGKSKGFGYINYKRYESAKEAVKNMNGKIINGKKLYVQPHMPKEDREFLKSNSLKYAEDQLIKSTQYNNLHVSNLPLAFSDKELETLFASFGKITSVKIARDSDNLSKGFGFVCFESKESAEKALKEMEGYSLGLNKLKINFKQDREARNHYMKLKNLHAIMEESKLTKRRSHSLSSSIYNRNHLNIPFSHLSFDENDKPLVKGQHDVNNDSNKYLKNQNILNIASSSKSNGKIQNIANMSLVKEPKLASEQSQNSKKSSNKSVKNQNNLNIPDRYKGKAKYKSTNDLFK